MSPLLLLLIGMLIVIGGILLFRLHAFLALIFAAFVVAALTTSDMVERHEIRLASIPVTADGALTPGMRQNLILGHGEIIRAGEHTELTPAAKIQLSKNATTNAFQSGFQPGDRFIHHTQMSAAKKTAGKNPMQRIADGFGKTCLGIGILIAMAAIIGKTLMDSGAAERIVLGLGRAFGVNNTPLAFIASGFTLGIPVFFDTVFYLMIPLGKALRVKTGRDYLLYVLCIVAGGTMAHSLVPPTPGPLFVAEELGVDLGLMILAGCIVGLFTVTSGYFFARFANSRLDVPLRPSAELSQAELQAMVDRDPVELPGLFVSLLPIFLPVGLLATGTIFKMSGIEFPGRSIVADKNVALTLGAICGLLLLAFGPKRHSRSRISNAVQAALASGGVIILITAAGGAFGHVLRQTDISGTIQHLMPATQTGLIPLAFLVTLIIRTAQGSATVAMITAVGIMSPLVDAGLEFHPVYLALAIGCGSKPISWMNDSGFWVISKMSGLTEAEMLKTNTIMGCVMATVGLGICMLGATLLPLI